MSATLSQIMAAKSDAGLLRRAIAAAESLNIANAQGQVEGAFGRIVAADVPDGDGATSIAYALDYHRTAARNAATAMNESRAGMPTLTVSLDHIGADPLGVSDNIIVAAVKHVLVDAVA